MGIVNQQSNYRRQPLVVTDLDRCSRSPRSRSPCPGRQTPQGAPRSAAASRFDPEPGRPNSRDGQGPGFANSSTRVTWAAAAAAGSCRIQEGRRFGTSARCRLGLPSPGVTANWAGCMESHPQGSAPSIGSRPLARTRGRGYMPRMA